MCKDLLLCCCEHLLQKNNTDTEQEALAGDQHLAWQSIIQGSEMAMWFTVCNACQSKVFQKPILKKQHPEPKSIIFKVLCREGKAGGNSLP